MPYKVAARAEIEERIVLSKGKTWRECSPGSSGGGRRNELSMLGENFGGEKVIGVELRWVSDGAGFIKKNGRKSHE